MDRYDDKQNGQVEGREKMDRRKKKQYEQAGKKKNMNRLGGGTK